MYKKSNFYCYCWITDPDVERMKKKHAGITFDKRTTLALTVNNHVSYKYHALFFRPDCGKCNLLNIYIRSLASYYHCWL